MNLWIKNGHVLDPANHLDEVCDVYVKEGKVACVGSLSSDKIPDECTVIDAEGKYVMPGLVDLHVHLREPGFEYKETIYSGTHAMAKGGFTAVCPMPNTKPVTDSPAMIEKILKIAKTDSPIHVYPVGAVTKGQLGEEMTDIAGMVKAGAKAISEDGKSVMNAEIYREAMKEAKKAGIPVLAHCEDKNMVGHGAMNAGEKAKELGICGITNAVEDVIVARDILLAKETGVHLHLCHCSTKDSVKMVRIAKKDGVSVSAEVCPHHFAMTEDEIAGDDANYKMNPPLRSKEDLDALIEGLKDGTVTCISTDHAPHSDEEKLKPIDQAPFGIIGNQHAFSLVYTYLVKKNLLDLETVLKCMTVNPSQVIGLDHDIAVGKKANIAIIDLNEEYTITRDNIYSKAKNTPFLDTKCFGLVKYHILDGKIEKL
mgnify:CR=1 FL=1